MIEFANFSLVLALVVAFLQIFLPLSAYITRQTQIANITKPLVFLQFFLISVAVAILINAFLNDNFLVKYVADNSNTQLPTIFKVSALWGAHEGSLLFWVFILSLWSLCVALFTKKLPQDLVNVILMVMGFISLGFIAFLIFTSNPFELLDVAPSQGRELNPLLQDFGLAIHPPMLYAGYVGTSVPFAFVIAALLRGKLDSTWLRWSRPWALVAFGFLTFGIVLGSWWAYYELGWGGWWFWDPVENASFMPWLVLVALIHSLSVSEKRSAFKHWTVLLAIAGFSLSLLGTFLVRSGVITSVHSFASDPERGVFILIFLAITVSGSLLLYGLRGKQMQSVGKFKLLSKETALLMNNILFTGALFTVLLGTLFPLFLDAFNLSKISVGKPYFEAVFVPIMIPAVVLMALGSFVRWKSDTPQRLFTALTPVWIASIVVVLATIFWTRNIPVLLASFLFIWVILHSLYQFMLRRNNLSASFLGMIIAHIGIGFFTLGATVTTQFGIEKDVKLTQGQSIQIAGIDNIRWQFDSVQPLVGPNYTGDKGIIYAMVNDEKITLVAEKRQYATGMPMTEAAIDPSLWRDLYVALGEHLGGDAWSFRIYYKPLVRFIWLGGLLIMFGAFIAMFDRRYRWK
jgi:cytochrome c-type biogenesis protein CcmF